MDSRQKRRESRAVELPHPWTEEQLAAIEPLAQALQRRVEAVPQLDQLLREVGTLPKKERKLLVARIHDKKLEVECTADKQVMSNVGPKLEDVLDACKTVTMAP